MAPMRVTVERLIPARAESLYALLADYRAGHPRILPTAFSDFRVLTGGTGEGTTIRFDLTLAGQKRRMAARVTEPAPGQVLAETYADGSVTTFTVEPVGNQSRLRIESAWEPRRGLAGLGDRILAPRLLAHLFRDELNLIEHWARNFGSPFR